MNRKKKDQLLSLLNEFEQNNEERKRVRYSNGTLGFSGALGYACYSILLLTSKQYKFIQRLVENRKIDRSKVHIYAEPYYDLRNYETDKLQEIERSEELLMLLSVQEDPVKLLDSIVQ